MSHPQRVGELRPNQLLHTYGVGAIADLPNLSVVVSGLGDWDLGNAKRVVEDRLLRAVQGQLGNQVETLFTPPYTQETADPFGEWARVGVPVRLFPRWLRCSDTRCNRLAPANSGLFTLLTDQYRPDRVRYVHGCRGNGQNRPTAVPARFTLACERGHIDEFPWLYYVHNGIVPEYGDHTLRLVEQGTTGEAANLIVRCSCDAQRSMAPAFGQDAWQRLPACRGHHPHLTGSEPFEPCGLQTRTLGLGATNAWFAMRLRVFSLPQGKDEVAQKVAENWGQLSLIAAMPEASAKQMLPIIGCWPDLEEFGLDDVWKAIVRHEDSGNRPDDDELDLAAGHGPHVRGCRCRGGSRNRNHRVLFPDHYHGYFNIAEHGRCNRHRALRQCPRFPSCCLPGSGSHRGDRRRGPLALDGLEDRDWPELGARAVQRLLRPRVPAAHLEHRPPHASR
jgi:hypothetical protein